MPTTQACPDLSELAIDVIVMPDNDQAWQRIREQFDAVGFRQMSRFDAIVGASLSPGELRENLTPRAAYELSVGRRYPYGGVHEGIPSIGAVGCYLSHVELWKRAAKRSVPTLILEQDAEPGESSGQIINALTTIPPGVDVAFLGHLSIYRPRLVEMFSRKPSEGFHPVLPTSDIFCTHAYVITPEGAAKLAERALPINAQVDGFMRFLCTPESGIRMVYHWPSLVRQQADVSSSIQPVGNNLDNLLQGSSMAFQAASSILWIQLCRPWRFLSKRFSLKPTRYILKEQGVPRYLISNPGIFSRLIRSAFSSYDSAVESPSLKTGSTSAHPSGKTIWTYWDQGIDALPAFNRLCILSWKHHNPEWSVVVLDQANIFNHLDRSDLPPEWQKIETATAKADLIRLALLARHGGVWMDSSILLQQNLDELVWDRIEQQSLDLAGFSIRAFSRDQKDDVFESWFIACKSNSHLVMRWHQISGKLWEDRYSTAGILDDPLFKGVDLKNIDGPEYLHLHCSFQALIQTEPLCQEGFFKRSYMIPADDTAFRWKDRHGSCRASGLALLGNEYDTDHFSSTPLLKFTRWPAGEIFARFNAPDLLDPRHTLGRLLRRNLPNEIVAGS